MRRSIVTLLTATLLSIGLQATAQDGLPDLDLATNTPRPAPLELNLATNTPSGPSATPTLTATATLTNTPTFTPTNTATPTNTPTATFTPTNTLTPTVTPSPTPTPYGPILYPEGINSLTGLPYPSDEALNRRNLIVKISNFPPVVRPQNGLNQADLIYEYETEGGVTRFAAIFRSNAPTHVGPVRSGRLMDLNLIPMYQGLLAYSGASGPVQDLLLNSDWRFQIISPSIGDNCQEAGFCRFPEDGLAFEHTLFVDTNKVWERADARGINDGYPGRGFAFGVDPDPNGEVINDIFTNYYGQLNARWQYQDDTGRYLRWTDGLPHLDEEDSEQIWADNIIVIEVPHNDEPDIFPPGTDYRTRSIDIELHEQGRAYVFRDGMWYQGFWRRDEREREGDALQLIYGNTVPIRLKPGRSWVMVTRWLGDTIITADQVDAEATAQIIELSATPTPPLLGPETTGTPQDVG